MVECSEREGEYLVKQNVVKEYTEVENYLVIEKESPAESREPSRLRERGEGRGHRWYLTWRQREGESSGCFEKTKKKKGREGN